MSERMRGGTPAGAPGTASGDADVPASEDAFSPAFDAADFSRLRLDERADRVVATLDHASTRNAIDQRMVDEFHAVCAELERRPRILIIAGANGLFASGADIGQMRDRRRDDALRGINSSLFDRIAKLPMPVIAAIEGYALGGGAELAFAADFRIAAPSAKIGNPETGLGIAAAAGALWRLRELVGEPVAKEILLAGRVLDAEEALALHFVTEVHEADALLDGAHALADRIARQDPLATRLTKAVFHLPREAHPVVDNIAQGVLFESAAKFERMQAFLDRREAKSRAKAQAAADVTASEANTTTNPDASKEQPS